jgi:putative transposase
MKKKRFSVEQMIGVLKQAQVGIPVAEVILKAGISAQTLTFYHYPLPFKKHWTLPLTPYCRHMTQP